MARAVFIGASVMASISMAIASVRQESRPASKRLYPYACSEYLNFLVADDHC